MSSIYLYLMVMFAISVFISDCGVQVIPERAKVVSMDAKYFYNFTFAVKRYGRKSAYYINIEATTKHEWNNNITLSLIFYEFLHNEYRRSFVELHYKYCDLLHNDKLLAPKLLEYNITCPLPVGTYRFMNLTSFPACFLSSAHVSTSNTLTLILGKIWRPSIYTARLRI